MDVQAAHAERRVALRPRDEPLRIDLRRSGRVRARGSGLLHRGARRRLLQRRVAALGRRVRLVRQWPHGHQVQLRQVPGTGGAHRRLRRRQPGAADGEPGHGELGRPQRQSHRRLRHRGHAGRGAPPASERRPEPEHGIRRSGVSQFHGRVRHAAVRQESVRARRGRLSARTGAHPVRPHLRRAAGGSRLLRRPTASRWSTGGAVATTGGSQGSASSTSSCRGSRPS